MDTKAIQREISDLNYDLTQALVRIGSELESIKEELVKLNTPLFYNKLNTREDNEV